MKKLLVFALGFIFIFGIVSAFSMPIKYDIRDIKNIKKLKFNKKITKIKFSKLCNKVNNIRNPIKRRMLIKKCEKIKKHININSRLFKTNTATNIQRFSNE